MAKGSANRPFSKGRFSPQSKGTRHSQPGEKKNTKTKQNNMISSGMRNSSGDRYLALSCQTNEQTAWFDEPQRDLRFGRSPVDDRLLNQSAFKPAQPERIISVPSDMSLYPPLLCGISSFWCPFLSGQGTSKGWEKLSSCDAVIKCILWELTFWRNHIFSLFCLGNTLKKKKRNQSQSYIVISECRLGKSYFPVSFPYIYMFCFVCLAAFLLHRL